MEVCIPPLGFLNTGAICYFNSLVQSLLSCKPFLAFLCKEENHESLFYYFLRFIAVDKQWDPQFTTRLLQIMNVFEPNQSSSEYFLKLCDYLKMDDLFQTKTETITTCHECKTESKRIDTSVYFLIDNEITEFCETKRDIEGFQCDTCKKKVNATLVTKIKQISSIMVFSFNKYFGKKNIHYPKGFIIEDKKYQLVATIEHQGDLNGGHYYCRTVRNGELLCIDDMNVSKMESIDPTENTYMAFYEFIN
jgi:uncharacterized UBP type Zn finger protein